MPHWKKVQIHWPQFLLFNFSCLFASCSNARHRHTYAYQQNIQPQQTLGELFLHESQSRLMLVSVRKVFDLCKWQRRLVQGAGSRSEHKITCDIHIDSEALMCENVIEMEVLETLLMYACGWRNHRAIDEKSPCQDLLMQRRPEQNWTELNVQLDRFARHKNRITLHGREIYFSASRHFRHIFVQRLEWWAAINCRRHLDCELFCHRTNKWGNKLVSQPLRLWIAISAANEKLNCIDWTPNWSLKRSRAKH